MDAKLKAPQIKRNQSATLDGDFQLGSEVYAAPQLIEYGNLAELTQFGGSGPSDFLGMQDGMN